ncbi:MAG: SRPBCC family protein [Polyangiales bacterium]
MTDIRLVREYPHPPSKVWRALTEPALMALWGMRPEGFAPVVGTRFRLVGDPNPGWRGFIEGEVLEAREPGASSPGVLRYSWIGNANEKPTFVTFTLEHHPRGTRVTFEHVGFAGVSGFLLAKLMMAPGWKKMLGATFPAVLADVDDAGALRPGSTLTPMFPLHGRQGENRCDAS